MRSSCSSAWMKDGAAAFSILPPMIGMPPRRSPFTATVDSASPAALRVTVPFIDAGNAYEESLPRFTDLRFGAGGRLASAETVSGDVFIDRGGRVQRGIRTVSGAIGLVGTEVGGDILTYTGNVTVGVASHVRGNLIVRKPNNEGGIQVVSIRLKPEPPRIVIGPNARVDGTLTFEHPVKLYVHRSARIGKVSGATPVMFDTPTPPRN